MRKWYEVVLILREVKEDEGKGFIEGLIVGDEYGSKKEAKSVFEEITNYIGKKMK